MKTVYAWLLATLLFSPFARAMDLPQPVLDALHQARIPVSSVGVVVGELGAAAPLIQANADRPMNPASTMKLLTTYAALELLGPAYSWKTEAWLDGQLDNGVLHGNLVIKGYGDPKITVEQLWMWLHELRNRGLREVDGDLVLDRSAFEAQEIDPGAFDNDPGRAYNVGPDALLLNFNAIRLRFMPNGDSKVSVVTEPALSGYTLDDRVVRKGRRNCADWDDNIHVQLQGATIQVRGNYPVNCGEHDKPFSLLPHNRYFDAVFRAVWQEVGGSLRGNTREGIAPPGATLLSTHYSQPLTELIRDINKFSNNVMARQLFLTLGASNGGPAPAMDQPETDMPAADAASAPSAVPFTRTDSGSTLADLIHPPVPASIARSTQAVRGWLAHKGLSFPELVLENGAGLSRKERISPLSMSLLLQSVQQSPLSAEVEASLPIVGVDGTMRKRLDNCPSTSHAHLKTGSLEGVKSIAGYVNSRTGKQWVMVFLINHPNAAAGQRAQDALVEWIEQQ
ncbi:MAG TPA: D-alanyl-D-alanine carboxypeptidase/D-alanyl-D-alanine-endopeptidase [Gallionellaceae bacterium]|nr:D-alanyl-D-alanine carboxypeptidase/D-alanyl-D-alanine-endopeptidase [Gallionellaceae bacterium]